MTISRYFSKIQIHDLKILRVWKWSEDFSKILIYPDFALKTSQEPENRKFKIKNSKFFFQKDRDFVQNIVPVGVDWKGLRIRKFFRSFKGEMRSRWFALKVFWPLGVETEIFQILSFESRIGGSYQIARMSRMTFNFF